MSHMVVCTFSRDEKKERATEDYLVQEDLVHKKIVFARDLISGGTWFGADDKGYIVMLFNGGFNTHAKKEYYKKSRGIILLDLIRSVSPKENFEHLELTGIEPFSIVLISAENFWRLTWDGELKHFIPLDNTQQHFFSSATLYAPAISLERRQWFNTVINEQAGNLSAETIFNFHRYYKSEDIENGLVIKRENSSSTLSISQAVLQKGKTNLKHYDIFTGKFYDAEISIS